VAAVREHLPSVRIGGIAAGLHVVARLPPGCPEDEVVAEAAAQGIKVLGISQYAVGPRSPAPALVLGYASLGERAIREGVAELATIEQVHRPPG
jgi:GntR family transcriptional regulator/MocR family aminotransferase